MGIATVVSARRPQSPAEEPVDAVFKEVRALAAHDHLLGWLKRHLMTAKRALIAADKSKLKEGATASSDYEATMVALTAAALAEIAERDDPLAGATMRGIEMMRQLIEAREGCINASKLAKLKGVTLQAIHQQRKRGQLIAIDAGRKELLLPVWQFTSNWRIIDGIPEVLAHLKKHGVESWDVFTFFLNPTHALSGHAPIDDLKKGNREGVMRAARLYDQHGAL